MQHPKILLLDNYDSFTYNLYQYLVELGAEVEVFKNDELSLEQIKSRQFSHLVISPGPGNPINKKDFGVCTDAINEFYKTKPILGVCLGHQGIASAFGAAVAHAPEIMHGMRSTIVRSESRLYTGLPTEFEVMRYHSLIVEDLPSEFVVTARTKDKGLIMSFEHQKYPLFAVQYHPESIGTNEGMRILGNFLLT